MYGIVRKPVTPGLREAMGASSKPALRIPVVRGGPWGRSGGHWERWQNKSFVTDIVSGVEYAGVNGQLVLRCSNGTLDPFAAAQIKDVVLHAPKGCTRLPQTDGTVEFYWEDERCDTCQHLSWCNRLGATGCTIYELAYPKEE